MTQRWKGYLTDWCYFFFSFLSCRDFFWRFIVQWIPSLLYFAGRQAVKWERRRGGTERVHSVGEFSRHYLRKSGRRREVVRRYTSTRNEMKLKNKAEWSPPYIGQWRGRDTWLWHLWLGGVWGTTFDLCNHILPSHFHFPYYVLYYYLLQS